MVFIVGLGRSNFHPEILLTLLSQNGIGNYSAQGTVKYDTKLALGGVGGVINYSAYSAGGELLHSSFCVDQIEIEENFRHAHVQKHSLMCQVPTECFSMRLRLI